GILAFEEPEELGRAFDAMAGAVREREEALARSERSYRRIVDTPAVGVVRVNPEGKILFANDAMARIMGATSGSGLAGSSILALYADPAERERVMQEVATHGRATNWEARARTRAGEERIILLNSVRDEDGVTSVIADVTESKRAAAERERLEAQLMHSQKLEAVGRLAGGVAHDFNNMLTAIIGYANVLKEDLPPGPSVHEAVDGIMGAAERAAYLTRSLLAYSRKQLLARRQVDLRAVVEDAARLIGRVLGEDVQMALALPEQPLPVLADAGQIDQVLMNLCTNARDAMPKGGVLTLSAERVALDDAMARASGLTAGGPFIQLRIQDTGVGMGKEVLARVFEPFFTTKPMGRGTGLGLAIVHGIVLQHDGAVSIESREGGGTTVTILLPMTLPEGPATGGDAAVPVGAPGGTETVLLAEDEPIFRQVVRRILERGGYTVIEAGNGAEAVEAFKANRERIALCVLDVVMPELNGRDALAAIRRIDPNVRALFTSGYAADILEARAPGEGQAGFIPKPVSPAELLKRVRQALDER
ncbi:MAG: ATP-binding protein, partial [Anaeromyxobacteraceae bacterium]